jgi:hypothetical protein
VSKVNATFFNIVNGIATAARTAQDPNAIALCNKMVQMAAYGFGTTYDAATASATPVYVIREPYPAGSIAPTTDSIFALGVTNIQRVGG